MGREGWGWKLLLLNCLLFRSLAFTGLALISLGTGGIKPCVSAFGGDQFKEEQVRAGQWSHHVGPQRVACGVVGLVDGMWGHRGWRVVWWA